MIYALSINVALLIVSHLNTWRPITFRALALVQVYYTKYILIGISAIVAFKYVRRHGVLPGKEEFNELVFGSSIPEKVITEYRMNWAAFILYTIITVTVKLFW